MRNNGVQPFSIVTHVLYYYVAYVFVVVIAAGTDGNIFFFYFFLRHKQAYAGNVFFYYIKNALPYLALVRARWTAKSLTCGRDPCSTAEKYAKM